MSEASTSEQAAGRTAQTGLRPSSVQGGALSGGQPVVICSQLNKVFKDFWMRDSARAVNNLSFEVRPREVFGLLGPNGSGKSTTIKIILGLLRPTSGRVAVFGKDPSDVEVKRRIGYLPEESYLYGFLNARETLEYYAKLFGLDAKTRTSRIDELLDMLGLARAQHRPVREYSKGMQRRIGIAQALINDPDFLILDEPTTGLDPLGTRQIKDLIIELGRRGKTILLCSHLLADVEDCVDRLVILYGGQKRAEGTCADLLESHDRTTIETDTLDDATVAEIDRVVRSRTQGERSVRRVSRPRQTLESLFVDIVEKARSEQVATSGATAGGGTASFLKADEGAALIDNLVRAADAPHAPAGMDAPGFAQSTQGAPAIAQHRPSPNGPDQSIIGALTSDAPQAPIPAAHTQGSHQPRPAQPPPSKDVDQGVIGSLLAGDDEGGGKQ